MGDFKEVVIIVMFSVTIVCLLRVWFLRVEIEKLIKENQVEMPLALDEYRGFPVPEEVKEGQKVWAENGGEVVSGVVFGKYQRGGVLFHVIDVIEEDGTCTSTIERRIDQLRLKVDL